MIDMHAMSKYGVCLGWVGGVNRRSVAELVIAFAINMLRHVVIANDEVRSGIWQQVIGGHLSDRTVGIIGCGHVGKDLVKLLKPFGCKLLVNDIVTYSKFYVLKQMLKNKLLAGAAFDVFLDEPPLDSELLLLPNFLATPHIGGSSEEAILAMGRAAIKGLETNALPALSQ